MRKRSVPARHARRDEVKAADARPPVRLTLTPGAICGPYFDTYTTKQHDVSTNNVITKQRTPAIELDSEVTALKWKVSDDEEEKSPSSHLNSSIASSRAYPSGTRCLAAR